MQNLQGSRRTCWSEASSTCAACPHVRQRQSSLDSANLLSSTRLFFYQVRQIRTYTCSLPEENEDHSQPRNSSSRTANKSPGMQTGAEGADGRVREDVGWPVCFWCSAEALAKIVTAAPKICAAVSVKAILSHVSAWRRIMPNFTPCGDQAHPSRGAKSVSRGHPRGPTGGVGPRWSFSKATDTIWVPASEDSRVPHGQANENSNAMAETMTRKKTRMKRIGLTIATVEDHTNCQLRPF